MKLWCYFSPAQHHAYVYRQEPAMLPYSAGHFAEPIGVWEVEFTPDQSSVRVYLSRRIKLLGYDPPFLNIDYRDLYPDERYPYQ